jgi:hypothetical protein
MEKMKMILRNNRCSITPECHLIDLLNAIDWLVCYLVEKSVRKIEELGTTLSSFDSKNAAQVYHRRTLSILYIQVINFDFSLNKIFPFISAYSNSSFYTIS